MTLSNERWLPLTEVARHFNLSKSAAYRRVESGEWPVLMYNGEPFKPYRIDGDVIRAALGESEGQA